jgi:hypothetical protein
MSDRRFCVRSEGVASASELAIRYARDGVRAETFKATDDGWEREKLAA